MWSSENIQKKQNEILEKKKQSQPSQIKTCGSTFKNISNEKKAWQLIKGLVATDSKRETLLSQKSIAIFL